MHMPRSGLVLRLAFILILAISASSCAIGVQQEIDDIELNMINKYKFLIGKKLSEIQFLTDQLVGISEDKMPGKFKLRAWEKYKTPEVMVDYITLDIPYDGFAYPVFDESKLKNLIVISGKSIQENGECQLELTFDDSAVVTDVSISGFGMWGSIAQLRDSGKCGYLLPRIFVSFHEEHFDKMKSLFKFTEDDFWSIEPKTFPVDSNLDGVLLMLDAQWEDDYARPIEFMRYCIRSSVINKCPPYPKGYVYRNYYGN